MRSNPERLAWTVLLLSLALCCALAVGVPAAGASFVYTATTPASLNVKLQSGRTVVYGPRESEADARVVGIDGRNIEEGSTIIVDPDIPSQAVLTVSADGAPGLLVAVQMYSGAKLRVTRANTPRFAVAGANGQIQLTLLAGRVSVNAQPAAERVARVEVRTDLASTVVEPGIYTVEQPPNETRVVVRDGLATVRTLQTTGTVAQVDTLVLQAGQRTVVKAGEGLMGILPPGQDLVTNGFFVEPLEPAWSIYAENIMPPKGEVRSINLGNETALLIDRAGTGLNWGRTGVTQDLNVNVSGRSSLQLRLVFSIMYQELSVCGGQGSECPLMITIGYRDKMNNDREWSQGFYADGTPSADLPDEVRTAPLPRTKHVKKGLGTRESFETDLFKQIPDLQSVRYVRLNAEGHGLRTIVYSTELILQD